MTGKALVSGILPSALGVPSKGVAAWLNNRKHTVPSGETRLSQRGELDRNSRRKIDDWWLLM